MLFSQFKALRMAELMTEAWGDIRIPDLLEVIAVAAPTYVLETGSYAGVSTEVWALHCAGVVSIDPSPDMAVRRRLHSRLAHYPHVTLIQERSVPALIPALPYDLIYLDGDHSYEAVREELAHFLSLKPRWIGGHDYTDTPAPGDGVKRAVDEVFNRRADYVFSDGSWLVKIGEV